MTDPRASYRLEDHPLGRVAEGTSQAAVLITDDKVCVAADPDRAFEAFLRFAAWLCQHMPPSLRWRAAHIAAAHGQAAIQGDARTAAGLAVMTSPTEILELAKEVLGPDAYAKLREAARDRMLGR